MKMDFIWSPHDADMSRTWCAAVGTRNMFRGIESSQQNASTSFGPKRIFGMTSRFGTALLRILLMACALAGANLVATAALAQADLVFINGKVFTADDRNTIAEAFA